MDRYTTITLFFAAVLVAGCMGADGASSPDDLDDKVFAYDYVVPAFVKHPPVKPEHVPVPAVDRCSSNCGAEWQKALDRCLSETAEADTDGTCNAAADEALNVCMDVHCFIKRPAASPCADTCLGERDGAIFECIDRMGYDPECIGEGDDVYQTCWESECLPGAALVDERIIDILGQLPEPQQDPEPPAGPPSAPTCREMCWELDHKIYLNCIFNDGDPRACRDHIGQAYDYCVAEHCPVE